MLKAINKGKEAVTNKVSEGMYLGAKVLSEFDNEKFNTIATKTINICTIIMMCFSFMISSVYVTCAFAAPPATEFDTTDAETTISALGDLVCKVFRYIGVVLALFSVGQLILAFKNEDADSKQRATMTLVIAVVLIGLKDFAWTGGLNLKNKLTT